MSEEPEGLKRRLAAIHPGFGHCGLLAPRGTQRRRDGSRTQTSTKACVRKERPLMEAGVVLLDSECRERVDLTRSPRLREMSAVCALPSCTASSSQGPAMQSLRAIVTPPGCILCEGPASLPSRMGWLQTPDRQAVFACVESARIAATQTWRQRSSPRSAAHRRLPRLIFVHHQRRRRSRPMPNGQLGRLWLG